MHSLLGYCELERYLSRNTLGAYRQDLAEFQSYFGDCKVSGVTGDGLVAYATHLSGVRRLARRP